MERRSFIRTAALATVVLAVPTFYYYSKQKNSSVSLDLPVTLGKFCSEEELKQIGVQYRSLVPAESTKEKLTEILLANDNNKTSKSLSNSQIEKLLSKKIQEEFSGFRTIVVNGWVITPTEARQCALFSLTQN